MKTNFKIPVLITVVDWQSFESLEETLRAFTEVKVNVKELSHTENIKIFNEDSWPFYGVVYVGRKPPLKKMKTLEIINIS